jgi:hypothetical protein
MGHWIPLADLPGRVHLLSLDLAYSKRGQLQSLALRPPHVFLELEVGDEVQRYRIAPAAVRQPFLLDPVVRGTWDVLNLYRGVELPRVSAFRVVAEQGEEHGFRGVIYAQVAACDGLWPRPEELTEAERAHLARCFFHMFRSYPFRFTAHSLTIVDVDGRPALLAEAPSELFFRVPAGHHRVSGGYGILEGAYTGEGNTDGVSFQVLREAGTGRIELHSRLLQPRTIEADRGLQRFTVDVDLPAESVLVFAAGCGPQNNGDWDWSYWTDLSIE